MTVCLHSSELCFLSSTLTLAQEIYEFIYGNSVVIVSFMYIFFWETNLCPRFVFSFFSRIMLYAFLFVFFSSRIQFDILFVRYVAVTSAIQYRVCVCVCEVRTVSFTSFVPVRVCGPRTHKFKLSFMDIFNFSIAWTCMVWIGAAFTLADIILRWRVLNARTETVVEKVGRRTFKMNVPKMLNG